MRLELPFAMDPLLTHDITEELGDIDPNFEWDNYPPPPTPRQLEDYEVNPDYFQEESLHYVELVPPGAPAFQLGPYEEEEDIIDDFDLLPPPRTPKPRDGPTDSDEELEMMGFSSEPYRPATPEEIISENELRERDYMAAFEAREEESSYAYPPFEPTAYEDLEDLPLNYEDQEDNGNPYLMSQMAFNEEIKEATDGVRTLSTNYYEMPPPTPMRPQRTKRPIVCSDSGTEMIDATDPAAASNSTQIEETSSRSPSLEDENLETLSQHEFYRPVPTPGSRLRDPDEFSDPEEHPEILETVGKKKPRKKILRGEKSGVVLGVEQMVVSGVLYHLIKCRKRGCVKNADLLRDVMNGQTKDLPEVIDEMTTAFDQVFGLKLLGADKAGTKKGGFSSYILVSKFPAVSLEVNPPPEEETAKRVFLFVLLTCFLMTQKALDEESLWTHFHETLDFTAPAGCHDRVHFRRFLREFVTALYIKAEKVKDLDQISYNYSWGPRSEKEVSKYKLLKFVAKTLGKRPHDFSVQYQMCLDTDKEAVDEDVENAEDANRANLADDGTPESLFALADDILRQSGSTEDEYQMDIPDSKKVARVEKAAKKASDIAAVEQLELSYSSTASEEEIFDLPRTPGRPHREESADESDIDVEAFQDHPFTFSILDEPTSKETPQVELGFSDDETSGKKGRDSPVPGTFASALWSKADSQVPSTSAAAYRRETDSPIAGTSFSTYGIRVDSPLAGTSASAYRRDSPVAGTSASALRRGRSRVYEPETEPPVFNINEKEDWTDERDDLEDFDEEEYEIAPPMQPSGGLDDDDEYDDDDDDDEGGAGTLESEGDDEEEEEEGQVYEEEYEEREIEEIDLEEEEDYPPPRTPGSHLDAESDEEDLKVLDELEREEERLLCATGNLREEDLDELRAWRAEGRDAQKREKAKAKEVARLKELGLYEKEEEEEVEEEGEGEEGAEEEIHEEPPKPSEEEEEKEEKALPPIPSPFPEERIEEDFDNLLSSPIPSPYPRDEGADEDSVIPFLGLSEQEQWSREAEAAAASVADPSQPYIPPPEAFPGELRLADDVDVEGLLTQGVSLQLQLVDVEPMDFDTGNFPD